MAGVAGAVMICRFWCNIVFMASCSLYSKSHLRADIWKSWSSSSISFNLFNKSELSADFIFIRLLSFLVMMGFCELCHHPVCATDLWGYDKEYGIEINKKSRRISVRPCLRSVTFIFHEVSEPSHLSCCRSLLFYRPVITVTGLIKKKHFNTHSFARVTKKTGFMVVSTRMYRIGTYTPDTNVL